MRKMRLELDALAVESFAAAEAGAPRGTVRGHVSLYYEDCSPSETCDGGNTCAGTCQSCNGTCVYSCHATCGCPSGGCVGPSAGCDSTAWGDVCDCEPTFNPGGGC